MSSIRDLKVIIESHPNILVRIYGIDDLLSQIKINKKELEYLKDLLLCEESKEIRYRILIYFVENEILEVSEIVTYVIEKNYDFFKFLCENSEPEFHFRKHQDEMKKAIANYMQPSFEKAILSNYEFLRANLFKFNNYYDSFIEYGKKVWFYRSSNPIITKVFKYSEIKEKELYYSKNMNYYGYCLKEIEITKALTRRIYVNYSRFDKTIHIFLKMVDIKTDELIIFLDDNFQFLFIYNADIGLMARIELEYD